MEGLRNNTEKRESLSKKNILEEVVMVSGNPNKVREVSEILNFDINSESIDLEEPQSLKLSEIVEAKALGAYEVLKQPVLVEDTALYFNALEGEERFPGPLIKWVEKSLGQSKMTQMLNSFSDRSAQAECMLGYFDGQQMKFFSGTLEGEIAASPQGNNGFGWDQIFIPEGHDRTMAQMTAEEKNALSMRGRAVKKFKEFVESNE